MVTIEAANSYEFCCLSLNRTKWLVWALLVCSSTVAQLHRDPTLDHHWHLWKKAYSKQYKEKVRRIAARAMHLAPEPYILFLKILFLQGVFSINIVYSFIAKSFSTI